MPGTFTPPEGGYKDAGDINKGVPPRIKRQAARFRIYGYDAAGNVVREITAAEATITWTAHLVNSKAEWDRFEGRAGEELPIGQRRARTAWRNRDIRGDENRTDEEARKALIIDPGPRTVSGPDQVASFTGGLFMGSPVPLGDLRTDASGRLLILGGFGRSGASEPGRRITNYANNDRWFDDVSDGPVTAAVKLADGRSLDVRPAWVIVAPPDFAPAITNVVTLYDVIAELSVGLGHPAPPARPSFTQHVYPLLSRAVQMSWVQAIANAGHGQGAAGAGHFLANLAVLASNLPEHQQARERVFARVRNPSLTGDEAKAQATSLFMPPLSGDDGDATRDAPGTWLALTRTHYDVLQKWARGDFEADWTGAPAPSGVITPEGLDRAALEACAGGAFYPGIEGGWMLRNKGYYSEPFRFDHGKVSPGDVTKRMACPWQADFFECQLHWWPAQRPDDVMTLDDYDRIRSIERQLANTDLGDTEADRVVRETLTQERARLQRERKPWARTLPASSPDGDNEMARQWYRLGFVVDRDKNGEPFLIDGAPAYVETETVKYEGLGWGEYFYYLANIEDYPDFLPKARELALNFFARADYSDPHYAPFDYTPEALNERMDWIYNDFVAQMDNVHWLDELKFSREAVIENLRQKAPMNLVDGAWLQNILRTGPCDEVQARLFSVWTDEAGNGKTEYNHCNVYDALLRSLNVYLPPLRSRQFAEADFFLPSAFENPVFQLAVGLFPQEFLPELLGMTLYLEWEATPTLTPTVRMLRGRNIDPHFYELHVAIDNVASGHGALAKEAVGLYLDRVRSGGGDREAQSQWRRIWAGYVTWATVGTFSSELFNLLIQMDGKQDKPDDRKKYAEQRMLALIQRKAPYARTAHGTRKLGAGADRKPLNTLFDDPKALLEALKVDSRQWINIDKPRESRLIAELMSFSGPMYKVFTPEDQDVILDWIESLREDAPPGPPVNDLGQRAKDIIDQKYAARARAQPRHGSFTLPDESGQEKSVLEWFQGPTEDLMAALARSQYIIRGSPEKSTFFTQAVDTLMAGILDKADVDLLREWVRSGCPAPGEGKQPTPSPMAVFARLSPKLAAAPTAPLPFALRRLFIGAGSVH